MTRRRGFSLIEVLVALGLIALLAWAVTIILGELADRRDRLETHDAVAAGLATVFDQLETTLATCEATAPDNKPGIRGDNTSLTIACRFAGPTGGEQRTAAATIKYNSGSISLTRGPATNPGPSEPLADTIGRARFRYYDGSNWLDEFDSIKQRALPRAVELAVWIAGVPDQQQSSPDQPPRPPDRRRIIAIPAWQGGGA